MLTRHVTVATSVAAAAVLMSAFPAMADGWGNVDCTQNPIPGCDLGAGSGGEPSAPPRGTGGSSAGGGGEGRSKKSKDPNLNLADCSYRRSDYEPPPGATQASYEADPGRVAGSVSAVYRPVPPTVVVADPRPGESGAWYVYKCTAGGVRDAVYRPPVWIPDAPAPEGDPAPAAVELAQVARGQLRLPSPGIEANPAGEQLVELPTWLWLERGGWERVSATASVPGVSVTAVARPVSVVWVMGDGGTVTCTGPGAPYAVGAGAKRASPDCGYTYRVSSAGQPGGAYAVSVTVHWTVTWAGAGQTGVFAGMTTASDAEFRVAESQALNNGG